MNNKFEFLDYTPTPSEKFLGIATVRVHGGVTIVLRYKIIAKKDGTGAFPTCASYKMPDREQGKEYDECFCIDSRIDNDALNRFIMQNVNRCMSNVSPMGFNQTGQQNNTNYQQSQYPHVFSPNPIAQNHQNSAPVASNHAQQNPNHNPYAHQQQSTPFVQRPEYQHQASQNYTDDNLPF